MTAILHLHLQALAQNKPGLLAISLDGDEWFGLPDELQDMSKHTELMKISKVTSNANAVGQPPFKKEKPKYRRIKVELSNALKVLYLDELEDFKIGNEYLGVVTEELRHDKRPNPTSTSEPKGPAASETEVGQLLKLLLEQKTEEEQKRSEVQSENKQEKQRCKLRDLKNLFLITEYDGKANAVQWIAQFEKECERLEVPNSLYVEALRMFIGKSLTDWYEGNVIKLCDQPWSDWRKAFVDTYTAKGWADVRSAFHFRHLGGSLIDYANAKERKLLEIDQKIPEKFRVYEIICGLPVEVQAKIDRDTETFSVLITKLRELDDAYEKRRKRDERPNAKEHGANGGKPNRRPEIDRGLAKELFVNKRPCSFCEAIGFKNNYHPIEKCKNKMKYDEMRESMRGKRREERQVNMNAATYTDSDLNSSQNSDYSQLSTSSSAISSVSKTSHRPKN